MNHPKFDKWKSISEYIYDFSIENDMEWPCTATKWGPVINIYDEYTTQRIFIGCRTDGEFQEKLHYWNKKASFFAVAEVDLPKKGYYFNKQM